jgi:prophage regulatory protein
MTYLSVRDLASRFNISRATAWRWCKTDPTFPQPVKLSSITTRWALPDIETWERGKCA